MVELNCGEADFLGENWELVKLLFLDSTHEASCVIQIFWESKQNNISF